MADVFLSYAREDAARAEQVARGLAESGVDVFWDNEIPPGTTWADYIEQKLTQCKALIVLWSEHSTKSQWVREEARMGRDKGVLIPAMIDACQAPFGFGEVQAANLAGWNGDKDDPNWRRFVEAVVRFAQAAPQQPAPVQPVAAVAPSSSAQAAVAPARTGPPVWVWIAGAVAALVVVVIGLAAIGGKNTPQQQAVAGQPQAAAGAPGAAPQQGGVDYQQQILDRLGQVEQAFVAQGFQQIAAPVSGQLPQGQFASVPVNLQAGGDYRIIGVCDNDCSDLDLVLYDENNNVISQDNLTDATPIVSVAPQWTGAFTVNAVMHNCTVQPCYYALVLYGRPAQQ